MQPKKLIVKFLPPIILDSIRFFKRKVKGSGKRVFSAVTWEGDFHDWNSAIVQGKGYDDQLILNRVRDSLLKVKNGHAVFERDSVLFDKIQYSWPLLACLENVALARNNRLHVIDFGGSLGSTFFQNRNFLKNVSSLKWIIVEQKHFVDCGKAEFENSSLSFENSIEEAMGGNEINCLILSGVLQYLPDPFFWIEKLCNYNIEYIILDRTGFTDQNRNILTLQSVSPEIYEASYPCWFFNEQKLIEKFAHKYEMISDFLDTSTSPIVIENFKGYWKGFFFKKKRMSKLNYANLGCGSHFHPDWTNIDFISTSEEVIAHNLLQGIPLENNSVNVVYHSHVLEHFPKDKASEFLKQCYRVLKPGGIIRIAIPDLEQIISHYVRITNQLKDTPENEKLWAEYDWIMMEMYDQTVRNTSGGEMASYLTKGNLINKEFILERCGDEVRRIMDSPVKNSIKSETTSSKHSFLKKIYRFTRVSKSREKIIQLVLGDEYKLLKMGRFRSRGEIHQWMYDRHSLGRLLNGIGFKNYEIKTAFESNIANWASYNLDGKNGIVRKPDSLFVEAKKPIA